VEVNGSFVGAFIANMLDFFRRYRTRLLNTTTVLRLAVYVGLFCGDTGLFCRDTRLFRGDTVLFCGPP